MIVQRSPPEPQTTSIGPIVGCKSLSSLSGRIVVAQSSSTDTQTSKLGLC